MKKASIVAVLGGTGGGKSNYLKKRLAREKPKRLAAWDFMREYKCQHVTESLGEFLTLICNDEFNVAFRPSMDQKTRAKQFDLFCTAVYRAGNCTVIAEELKHVTMPSWAPGPWSLLTTTGRHKGVTVYGTSQRPASIDKDFLGNCTEIVTFGLTYPNDVTAVAGSMGQRSGSDLASKISLLKDYWFIYFKDKEHTLCRPIS